MSYDLTEFLRDWEYQPGQVAARRFQGEDGQDKIQLRVDLGILQMNAQGRPDGKRPMGLASWFDVQKQRLARFQEEHDGEETGFRLVAEDCAKLQQECIQYHHRYICLFQLEDFEAVLEDCDRNFEVFEFVSRYAATPELAWSLLQFVPQLIMMRVRAAGMIQLRASRHDKAVLLIEEALSELEAFYREHGRDEMVEASTELQSLRLWLMDVQKKRPLSEVEKLKRALDEAIQVEDYEKAAEVRDQLRKLEAS